MSTFDFGALVAGPYAISGGEARLFERGLQFSGQAGAAQIEFHFPMIGVPYIAKAADGQVMVLPSDALQFEKGPWYLDQLVAAAQAGLNGRIALIPTGGGEPIIVSVGTEQGLERPRGRFGLKSAAQVAERQLYDVALKGDDGQWRVIAPHAVYFRSAWKDFGIAHITDIHIARRIDGFHDKLVELGKPEAAAKLYNWNDRFRGFIKYANYLHGAGVLDLILATGDILDYLYEDNDDPAGGGNAKFARDILLGRAPGPQFPEVEELKVPIFMVTGNHDYRKHPYRLIWELDLGPKHFGPYGHFSGYHILREDAIALNGGISELGSERASRPVLVDQDAAPIKELLTNKPFYKIELDAHRIVMLDSTWDVGVVTTRLDGLLSETVGLPEDKETFLDGSPNSEGVSSDELKLMVDTLAETPTDALYILGIHAPLFNPWKSEFPYYFRESQRPSNFDEVVSYLGRIKPIFTLKPAEEIPAKHPSWFDPANKGSETFFKRGSNDELFDYGVSRGGAESVIKHLVGIGNRRRADLVLQGHIHAHNDFRLDAIDGEVRYFMDFYTDNPVHYYPSKVTTGWKPKGMSAVVPETEGAYMEVVEGAPTRGIVTEMPYDAIHDKIVRVPPYHDPLNSSADPKSWWDRHRPLVLQTSSLGPLDNSQATFTGFRVILVRDNVIQKIHHVSTPRLHEAGYRLAFEEAIKPEGRPPYRHLPRSEEFDCPKGTGSPFAYSYAPLNVTNIVYRGENGHLYELWRDGEGKRGGGDITRAANVSPAAGDPYVYQEAATGYQIVLYRGNDGHVHSLYWTTGAPGHDALSASAGAPQAAGNPVGYLNTKNNYHHVVYRAGDGHLYTIYWTGPHAAQSEGATKPAGAPKATGDPAPYFDPIGGDNVVIYRAEDGHIHSLYWSDGPIGHDNLSGYANAPKAAGDPRAFYTQHDNAHQVHYRSSDGKIHELWWVGPNPVNHWDLSAASGAPAAAGDPSSFYCSHTNTKHVIYRGADGHLHDLAWVPGGGTPVHTDLSVAARAQPAAGDPHCYSGPDHNHVVYRGTDGHVHEILLLREDRRNPVIRDFAVAHLDLSVLLRPGGGQ